MPEKLPKEWVKTTLGEVCAMNPRTPFDETVSEHTEVSFVPMAAVQEESGRLDASQIRTLGSVQRGYTPFRENDVIFAKITPCMENGKIALATDLKNGLAFGSTEFFVFRPYEGVLPRFILYFLLQPKFREDAERQMTGASGQKRVPAKYLSNHEFWLPPTSEQERIVMKLDASLSKLERAEVAAQRGQKRLRDYHAAVMRAAVRGDLTREWRKINKPVETGSQFLQRLLKARRSRWEAAELRRFNEASKPPNNDEWKLHYLSPQPADTNRLESLPEGWVWATVEQLASGEPGAIQSGPFGSQLLHSEFRDKGILAIGIDNVLDGVFSLGRQHRITLAKYVQLKKFTARPLDVVITVMATVGRVCVLPKQLETAIITKHCYRISPASDFVDSNYLAFALRADAPTREHIFGNIRGLTRAGINGSILKAAPVPLPPLLEQAEITREVEHRLSAANRLAATVSSQIDKARVTRQSLLHEAFAGQLIPQHPNDKPASVLLQRIRAASEAEAKKPKGKRMSKSKSKTTHRSLLDVLREHDEPITPETLFRDSGFEAMFNESDEPQDVVDAFYKELRKLTDKPAKISEQKDSRHPVMLKALP